MPNTAQGFISKLRLKFDIQSSGQILLCSVLIGFLAGLGACFFHLAIKFTESGVVSLYNSAGISFPSPEWTPASESENDGITSPNERWGPKRTETILNVLRAPKYWILLLLVPAFGGLVCGLIIQATAPEAATEGVDSIIKSFHRRNGMMRTRAAFAKAFASIATIGTGGSGGIEGGIMMFGAGLGNFVSNRLKINAEKRRLLLLAGAAGGFGAVFQTPLGGAMLIAEILYCSTAIELGVVIPCFIASIVGFHTFRQICYDLLPHIEKEAISIGGPEQTLVFIVLAGIFAICCAGLGTVFVRFTHELHNRVFRRSPIPEFFKPAIGGFMLGLLILLLPHVRGSGEEWFQLVIEAKLPILILIGFLFAKMLATSITMASGGSGGYIIPSLLIGAIFGSLFGQTCEILFESLGIGHLAPSPVVFALVGMGAFFAGIGKVPLAATIIVCEFAGVSYSLTLPLLLVSIAHLAIHSPRTSLYEEQVLAEVDSPAHLGDYLTDLLETIPVKEAIKNERSFLEIDRDMLLPNIFRLVSESNESVFPVVDKDGKMLGFLVANDIQAAFLNHGNRKQLLAIDLMQSMEKYVQLEDNLLTALRACYLKSIDELPVVDSRDNRKIVGILHREDIITEYNKRLSQFRALDENNTNF